MKKSLLLSCLFAITALTVSAQKKFTEPTPVKMENIREWKGEMPESVRQQLKANAIRRALRAKKNVKAQAPTLNELVAKPNFKTYSHVYVGEDSPTTKSIEEMPDTVVETLPGFSIVEKSGRSGVNISHFIWQTNRSVSGTYSVEEYENTAGETIEYGLITIEQQVVYTSENYGDCRCCPYTWYEDKEDPSQNGWYYFINSPISGYVLSDGSIIFDGYALVINEGQYKDYMLGYGTLQVDYLPSNALMTTTYLEEVVVEEGEEEPEEPYEEVTETYAVQVTVDGNNIQVENFNDEDVTFIIKMADDHTITIPQQPIWDGTASGYDEFVTYAANWEIDEEEVSSATDYITGNDIKGLATPTELMWGNWWVFDGTYAYYSGMPLSSSIKFTDGSLFYGDADAISSVKNDKANNNVWYTINGVRLAGKPSVKGLYINNGKKVLVK